MAEQTNDTNDNASTTPLSGEALDALQQGLVAEDHAESSEVRSENERYLKLHEAHKKLRALHYGTDERLKQFEHRLKKVESSETSSTSGSASVKSEASDLEDDHQLGYEENTIPETRDVSFELFKNRYGEKDGKNCVEVLVAGSDFDEQVRQELDRRGELDEKDHKRRVNYDDDDEVIIQRVRIQSPAILWLLCKTLDHPNLAWKGQNRTTFYRPFGWFTYVHEKMKAELKNLEDHWSTTSTYLTEATKRETVQETLSRLTQLSSENKNEASTVPEKPELISDEAQDLNHESLARRTERSVLQAALLANYHTLLELRCYTEFIEKRILPPARRFEDPDTPEAHKIRYQDLWFLFQPGELVVLQRDKIRGPMLGNFHKSGAQIGRLCGRDKPAATSTYRWTKPTYLACASRKSDFGALEFIVDHYSLDYNGRVFGRVVSSTTIPFFEGLQEITNLPVYPLRFHTEQEDLKKHFTENGSKFRDAVSSRHMGYCGWTRTWLVPMARPPPPPHFHNTKKEPSYTYQVIQDRPNIIGNSTYIESDVVIDVKEAIRASHPSMISFINGPLPYPDMHACQDLIEIIRWSDQKRTEKLSLIQDRTQVEDAIPKLERLRFMETDPFTKPQEHHIWTPDDILLLSHRIHAFALRERKFFEADVRFLLRLQTDIDAFDSLKIDPGHIRIVKALVSSHFQRKEMEEIPEFMSVMDQDLIRGKGRGLVILLHGAPGVGKTATAEAVALWHKRPLFVITCGDLGFTPEGVESSLSEIFRLAHLWNCILLLDEADVFLSQRETNSLQRNALVSVFLRVLEYYNGILFLTTNRVGALDEAFKSRVHLSLYYPALGKTQTEEITRINLVRLHAIEQQRAKATGNKPLFIKMEEICRFSTDHWDRHGRHDGEGRWNGRQIRNAVQIAASLAWYDRKASTDPGAEELPPILDERHFQTVEQTMTLFEGYMTKTRGGTDTFISQQRSERYDRFKGGDPNSWERGRPIATGPDPSGSAGGGQATSGYYNPYQSRQRTTQEQPWSQNPMTNTARPADPYVAGPSFAGPPNQSYGQNLPHYPQHQVQAGYGGLAPQQPAHMTPSPSLMNMHTGQMPQMPPGPTAGAQGYSQSQMPPLGHHDHPMASGAMYPPEHQQGASYQPGDSIPRSSQHTGNDVFGSIGAMNSPSTNPDGDNRPPGQPPFQQQG